MVKPLILRCTQLPPDIFKIIWCNSKCLLNLMNAFMILLYHLIDSVALACHFVQRCIRLSSGCFRRRPELISVQKSCVHHLFSIEDADVLDCGFECLRKLRCDHTRAFSVTAFISCAESKLNVAQFVQSSSSPQSCLPAFELCLERLPFRSNLVLRLQIDAACSNPACW